MEIQGYSAYGIGSFTGLLNSESNQGVSLNTNIDTDDDATSAFAQDIILRLESQADSEESDSTYALSDETETLSNAGALQSMELESEGTDAEDLANSLARAVDHIRENYGDEAASATMGLIYQNIGDGTISEDSLGDGLVSAVKLIDSNFGFAAGDEVMSFFNSDINESMNSYFDNGLMEEFYASTSTGSGSAAGTGSSSLPQAITTAIGQVGEETNDETASSIMEILTSSLEENGKSVDSLKNALSEAQSYLDENFDAETAASLGSTLSQGLAQSLPDAPVFQAMSQQGALLDITV